MEEDEAPTLTGALWLYGITDGIRAFVADPYTEIKDFQEYFELLVGEPLEFHLTFVSEDILAAHFYEMQVPAAVISGESGVVLSFALLPQDYDPPRGTHV